MDIRAALFAPVIALVGFAAWCGYRRLQARRKFRQAQRFREGIRPPSLQEQSRPYRVDLWAGLQYPLGSMEECHSPPERWTVFVNV